jgi:hypothetical protein
MGQKIRIENMGNKILTIKGKLLVGKGGTFPT